MNNAQLILVDNASTKNVKTSKKSTFNTPSHEDFIWISTSLIHFSSLPMQVKFVVPVVSTVYNFIYNIASSSSRAQFENYNQAVADSLYSIGTFAISYGVYAYSPQVALALTFAEIFLSSEIKEGVKEPIMNILESIAYPITAAVAGIIAVSGNNYAKHVEDSSEL